MAIAADLLTLAEHLTVPSATDPEQAWLRRSISTAYYSLIPSISSETTAFVLRQDFCPVAEFFQGTLGI